MKLYRFKIKLYSPFLTSLLDSYTLFGALCWNYRLLYGEKALLSFLKRFEESPPFLLSSPLLNLEEETFFPIPQMPDDFDEPSNEEEYKLQKKFKKLSWIPQEALLTFLTGKIKTKRQLKEYFEPKSDLYEKSEKVKLSHFNRVSNSINRITWTTFGGEVINVSAYYYPEFAFFLYMRDETFLKVEEVARLFEMSSLGGNKSTGYGKVKEVSYTEDKELAQFLSPQDHENLTIYLLSPSFPDEAFDYEKSFFQVKIYCGKIDNFYERLTFPILKKRALYLTSGSQIKVHQKKEFYGALLPLLDAPSLLDSSKKIKVYQYGLAFPLYVGKS